jgi:hypothetical protein
MIVTQAMELFLLLLLSGAVQSACDTAGLERLRSTNANGWGGVVTSTYLEADGK